MRWNGSSWLPFATVVSPLNAVWADERGVFVGGNEGFVARFSREDGRAIPSEITEATPFPHLRIQNLLGLGTAVVGAATTMELDMTGDWRGAIIGHRRSFAGPLFERSQNDAGIPDASQADAGISDATPTDAGISDADVADASP